MIRTGIRQPIRSGIRTAINAVGTLIARIAGTRLAGQTLSIVLGPDVTASAYEWRRDGVAISGATSSTYTLTETDEDTMISCYVSGPDYLAGPVYVPDADFLLMAGGDYLTVGGNNISVGVPA